VCSFLRPREAVTTAAKSILGQEIPVGTTLEAAEPVIQRRGFRTERSETSTQTKWLAKALVLRDLALVQPRSGARHPPFPGNCASLCPPPNIPRPKERYAYRSCRIEALHNQNRLLSDF